MRIAKVDDFLRRYNENPHNNQPKKKKWMLLPDPTPQPDQKVYKIPKNTDVYEDLKKIK